MGVFDERRKEKEVTVHDFRSQRACLGQEGHFFWVARRYTWGKGKLWRAEGDRTGPLPRARSSVEGTTHKLAFAAEQIFLLPLCRLETASSPASTAGLQSGGLELWAGGQLGHPRQMGPDRRLWGPGQRALLTSRLPLLTSSPGWLQSAQDLPSCPFSMWKLSGLSRA